uniref:Molybdopterin molybdenumtransferase MoeA n=1 Tax=Ignisphaera aggregans TaxID=334771 RepID=A0A7C2VKV1_9CREN
MGKKLEKLMPLEQSIERMASEIKLVLRSETVSLLDSIYRIASRDIVAESDIPFFDRSAVDGYAVRAEDTYGASEFNPIILRVVGEVRPGEPRLAIGSGEAAKISTGMPLPLGANAVVMVEDVVEEGNAIYVTRSVGRYTNVALQGEDIQRGKVIIKRGTLIEPKHVAALATLGIGSIEVYERPRICVVCTGSEVVEPGSIGREEVFRRGLTYNSTGPLIITYIKSLGFLDPIYMGFVEDSRSRIRVAVEKAVEMCHAVITTGGAGPSAHDLTLDAVEEAGGKIIVRGIAMRPGRPTSGGIVNGKPVFMLSGFPVASFIGLKYFALPVMEKVIGMVIPRRTVMAKLTKRIANVVGYTSFVRVKLLRCLDQICAEPVAVSGSGTISTLLDSDGILVIPPNIEGFDKDQVVEVELV